MFWTVFTFELAYWFKRPLTLLFFALFSLVSIRERRLRNGCWTDSRIAAAEMAKPGTPTELPKPDRSVEFGTPEYFELAQTLAAEGRPDILALRGEVLVLVGNEKVLVKGAGPEAPGDGI